MKKLGTQCLETDRLVLRRFAVTDADAMYRNWASDPEVTRYLTWPCHASPEATAALLADWVAQYEDGGVFQWAIQRKDSDEGVIGSIAAVKLDETVNSAEIGYCLGRAYWGQGIMPEALRAVMDFLFDEAEVNRIAAYHDVRNPNSGRVMQKAGMRYEGTLRQAGKNNQGICDLACYAALREDKRNPQAGHPLR